MPPKPVVHGARGATSATVRLTSGNMTKSIRGGKSTGTKNEGKREQTSKIEEAAEKNTEINDTVESGQIPSPCVEEIEQVSEEAKIEIAQCEQNRANAMDVELIAVKPKEYQKCETEEIVTNKEEISNNDLGDEIQLEDPNPVTDEIETTVADHASKNNEKGSSDTSDRRAIMREEAEICVEEILQRVFIDINGSSTVNRTSKPTVAPQFGSVTRLRGTASKPAIPSRKPQKVSVLLSNARSYARKPVVSKPRSISRSSKSIKATISPKTNTPSKVQTPADDTAKKASAVLIKESAPAKTEEIKISSKSANDQKLSAIKTSSSSQPAKPAQTARSLQPSQGKAGVPTKNARTNSSTRQVGPPDNKNANSVKLREKPKSEAPKSAMPGRKNIK